ncbi:MAG: HAMP domain-containing histidine kinase, partial [Cellulomonadaceae bacterium]|nr:HAMP domain-containing histidine kinase [Cellulomonadaceae bacterium]
AVADGVLPPDATTMATLQEQTDRLSHLVADMAAVSRAEERQLALDLQRLDVAEAARRAVTAHQARFTAAGRRLDLDVRSGLHPVRADARRLGEALGNLLDNAAEHSPRGGTVRVVVRTAPTGAAIEVHDTGSGFLPDEAERLFERFYRGDASRTGAGAHSGVGLTIARAIAEAQGGTLLATSAGPGTGATFTLTLQRDPDHG